MLTITILLLSRDRVSAKELSKRFEVSVRTIYRDMDAINLAGIPIISYPGNDGGFGIMEGFKLDRQIFTTRDMVSILSPLQGINSALNSEEIEKVIDKIHSLIPNNERERVNNSLNRMIIDVAPWGDNKRWKKLYETVQKAIENQRILILSYVTGEGKSSVREVEPMTLIFKNFTWYLWGYCLNRFDYRLFKLHRIKDITRTDKKFIHRGDSYREPTDFTQELVKLKLQCDKGFLTKAIEKFGFEYITELEDKIEINIEYPRGEWIKEYILGLSSNIEVLEPNWLRDEIKTDLIKLSNIYC